MATTSIPHRWKYDVFVSFRGEDIRKNFMDHMFNDFKQKGIHAFRDDRELPKGEEISPHLYKAIEESRFLIVIFSKNYASSTWCLRELVKILECKQIEDPKHEVRIIFYDAKPDVVRKQKSSYAKAFAKHDVSNRTEVDKWREALSNAANLSGWDLLDMTNGYESKFIDCISKEILNKLCDGPLHIGDYLVGIDFHFDKLEMSRFVGSDKVNMIGICGISGIGKTTLAKAIYNLMYIHFEGSCFCENVKDQQDLTQVQMQLIDDIMKTRALKISNVGQGIMVIKKMMSSKPILLVLDDVDHRDQLKALAGSASWFCPGSLIIFTGKDKQLLRSHRVDENEIHDMDFLDQDESFKLFSFYAFKEKHPCTGFHGLADKAVKYVQGHPLALIVLGCFLYGKTVRQWVSELDRLKTHPNEEMQQVLRLSYDGLNPQQQNILLDIACLFIRENSDFVASILDGCSFFADTNMQVLVDKSLITISSNNSLQMHDLIQAMARKIIHEESIMTGKQRRLWNSSEVYNVLSEKKVARTEAVEVLVLLLEKLSQKVHIDANDFAHMKKLRILKIYQEEIFGQKHELEGHNVIFSGNLYYLSNELSLFYWHGCPFKYLPSNFYPENIVAIDLSYSNINNFWTTPKCFRRLKVMKLRYCCNLTTTPDFSEITNLEELSLEGCVNLVSVHPSIGVLERLVVLNLAGCLKVDQHPSFVSSLINLASLSFGGQGRIQPRWWTSISGFIWKQQHPQRSVSLAGLHMLKKLNFSYCNLVQVPEGIGGLSCLKRLDLEGNNLLEVPEGIGGLSCLEILNFGGNNFTSLPESLSQLSHLKDLRLDGCKKLEVLPELPPSLRFINASNCTSLREVPESIGGLSYLCSLHLGGNNFTSLPGSLSQLSHLQRLRLDGCKKLEALPELPHSLHFINASDCTSLREVPESIGGLSYLCSLHLGGNNFTSLPGSLSQLSHLQNLILDGCKKLEVLPELPPSLQFINASDCTSLREVPESIGGLSYLCSLHLGGNNFTSLPGSLSQLSHLQHLRLDGCKKLEALPELPRSLRFINASDCTSLREVSVSSKDSFRKFNVFRNCPKLLRNVTIYSQGSISKTQCLDSSITSQGSIRQLVLTNGCEFFKQDTRFSVLDIAYHGNSIPEWFTNRSTENHVVKVELPSDWCYDKFRGYGTCVVLKRKKPHKLKGYSVKNFDGASLDNLHDYFIPVEIKNFLENEVTGIQDSYMIWLRYMKKWEGWKEAKNFVTFCFKDVEVKECGVRVVYDEENNENVTKLEYVARPPSSICWGHEPFYV